MKLSPCKVLLLGFIGSSAAGFPSYGPCIHLQRLKQLNTCQSGAFLSGKLLFLKASRKITQRPRYELISLFQEHHVRDGYLCRLFDKHVYLKNIFSLICQIKSTVFISFFGVVLLLNTSLSPQILKIYLMTMIFCDEEDEKGQFSPLYKMLIVLHLSE